MPEDVVGIDQYIGDIADLYQGHVQRMIQAYIQQIILPLSARQLIVDPAPDNAAAIACYRKLGFVSEGEIRTPDGQACLMCLDLQVYDGRIPE